jgi:hypothetical protein
VVLDLKSADGVAALHALLAKVGCGRNVAVY